MGDFVHCVAYPITRQYPRRIQVKPIFSLQLIKLETLVAILARCYAHSRSLVCQRTRRVSSGPTSVEAYSPTGTYGNPEMQRATASRGIVPRFMTVTLQHQDSARSSVGGNRDSHCLVESTTTGGLTNTTVCVLARAGPLTCTTLPAVTDLDLARPTVPSFLR